MSVKYQLGITSIDKDTAVLDIYFEGDSIESYVKKLVPGERYDFLKISKKEIYLDMDKAQDKIYAIKQLWEMIHVDKIIVYISNNLLEDDNSLEHVLSNITRCFFQNIYKDKGEIIFTHQGTTENKILKNVLSMVQKIQIARYLSMLPGNVGTPEVMVTQLKKLFKKVPHVNVKILSKDALYKQGFGLIKAVGSSAMNPPYMMIAERMTNPKNPTVCLVGKGITFDSGGLALKPYKSIINMKFDKIGAVNAAIAMMHLCELKELKDINFVAILPFAENSISDKAVRPGDVVKSYLGKTVEIIDPDAEGRLVLADAFGYAHKYKPTLLIDIATLTGHAKHINCWHYGYYFAQPNSLKNRFEKLTDEIGERMIPMPTWTEYREVLNSTVADMINSPLKCSDSFVAALFLKEFIPNNCDWIHIDVTHEYDANIPKGNGIRSIVYVVEDYFKNKK